jgi:ABC-2 type transport system permease protein
VSLVTGRALVFGLAYVLIWEGLLAGLFAGTQTFSIRQLSLAFADAIGGIAADVLDAPVTVTTALIVGTALLAIATAIAIRRLSEFEISGESA